MRYSHEHKFILVNNWKCGCSSMCAMFDEYCTPCGDRPWNHSTFDQKNNFLTEEFGLKYWQVVHARAKQIKDIFNKKDWEYDKYIKISSTRNPWARIVSLYSFLSERNRWPAWNIPDDHMETFDAFVQKCMYRWMGGPHRWNTYEMHRDDDGKLLVDYVVRLEHLEEDLRTIINDHFPTFNIDYNTKTNTPEHKHYSTYYNNDTKSIIGDVFAYDIEKWGYKFENAK